MFRLRKDFRFEAAHQLMLHDGKCKNLHGHSWNGFLEVEGGVLHNGGPQQNMLVDYYHLGQITKQIENKLDHKHLNEVFESDMPTSEFIAKKIFDWISEEIEEFGVKLRRVVIMETCTSRCDYFGEDSK